MSKWPYQVQAERELPHAYCGASRTHTWHTPNDTEFCHGRGPVDLVSLDGVLNLLEAHVKVTYKFSDGYVTHECRCGKWVGEDRGPHASHVEAIVWELLTSRVSSDTLPV